MKKIFNIIMLGALLAVVSNAFAADEEKDKAKDKSPWTSTVELGFIRTTGNTVTQTTAAKADSVYEIEKWRYTGHIEAYGQQADNDEGKNEVSAERYAVSGKADYKFSVLDYVFGLAKWDKDRFSGFKYETSFSVGYGRKVINKDDMELDLEIGPGIKFYKEDEEQSKSEAILRLAGNYWWEITDTSKFIQKLSTEIGEQKTTSESITGVQANINKTLALKFTYTVTNKSKVPDGSKKTDTIAGMTLVYNF